MEIVILRDDFVDLAGFTDSGLVFVPGLDLADSVGTACKYCSSSGGKRGVAVQRTEGAGTFEVTRTDGPVRTADEMIDCYFKYFEKEVETGSDGYRGSCYGNPYDRVRLSRSFLFLLYYIMLPSFY